MDQSICSHIQVQHVQCFCVRPLTSVQTWGSQLGPLQLDLASNTPPQIKFDNIILILLDAGVATKIKLMPEHLLPHPKNVEGEWWCLQICSRKAV